MPISPGFSTDTKREAIGFWPRNGPRAIELISTSDERMVSDLKSYLPGYPFSAAPLVEVMVFDHGAPSAQVAGLLRPSG